jgi:hypothetical protein
LLKEACKGNKRQKLGVKRMRKRQKINTGDEIQRKTWEKDKQRKTLRYRGINKTRERQKENNVIKKYREVSR